MIDLPAPVSPESTLKPGASGSVSDSMIAKFLMRSSVSIRCRLVALAASHPSRASAAASRRSVAPGKRTMSTGRPARRTVERLAGGERRADLAVDRHQKLLGPIFRLHRHLAVGGSTSGRIASVCGETGVRRIVSSVGTTTGPPADRLYAVDPVGVEITTPSAA